MAAQCVQENEKEAVLTAWKTIPFANSLKDYALHFPIVFVSKGLKFSDIPHGKKNVSTDFYKVADNIFIDWTTPCSVG